MSKTFIGSHEKGGSDIMLNMLNILESGRRRERKEREQKHIMDYIILSLILIMNTEISIYRETMSKVNLIDLKYQRK
jgi:hypothetical protein